MSVAFKDGVVLIDTEHAEVFPQALAMAMEQNVDFGGLVLAAVTKLLASMPQDDAMDVLATLMKTSDECRDRIN